MWDDLETEIGICTKCHLERIRRNPVTGKGNKQARVLFILENVSKKEDLKKVSAELFDTIAEIIDRPRGAFTLDLVESVAILDGEEISRANIEIGWVARPVEVCEKVANAVGEIIKPLGYETVMVSFKSIDLAYEFTFTK